jgi:hypothetical protein
MLPYRDSRITKIVLVVFFIIVVLYAYYEGRGLIYGPSIVITTDLTTVNDQFVMIRGQAERISSLSINGKEIPVTENGAFAQPYVLAEGSNRIVFEAHDKYGRTQQKIANIVYIPSTPSTPTAAATTTPLQ